MRRPMLRRMLMLIGLAALALAGPGWAGEKYDSFGAHSPKVIQSDDTIVSEWDQSAGAKKVTKTTLDACERNPSSLTNSWCATRPESSGAVISDGTGAKTVSANPAHLVGVYLTAALAGTLTITCLNDEAGVAAPLILPIGAAAGFHNLAFARCETSLSVKKSSASDDDKITVFWRPL